jgi:hypothetical protein
MNRTVLIGAIVVLLAAGGYYYYTTQGAPAPAADEAAPAAEEAAPAAEEAAPAAEEAAPAAEEAAPAAEEAAPAAEEAAPATDAAAVLDPANFDAAAINALIDGSSLGADVKATLKSAVDAAAANPALVQPAIDQVKAALGL